uniref:CCHC-type domain-containing protein n=1 Tax=Meloidogyne enterolobii TaxID=390850 RepID=A0A6V7Y2S5_MELEN|nr:unnamed protein product [Meloidogyne enterolobii]
MSAPYRDELRFLYADATEILNNRKEFEIPQQLGSISLHHANIRSKISALDLELDTVSEILKDISSAHDRWMSVRSAMTGAERLADNPLYDVFVLEIPYISSLNELRNYSRRLRVAKSKLVEALPDPSKATDTLFHLPKLSLPKFSGKCVEFTSFWNAFRVGVHELTNISDSIKFNYLKECLEGPPLLLIKSLPLTEASYHEAIRLIKENYGNVNEINRTLHHSIRKLPVVHSKNGPENLCAELRSFVDQFEAIYLQMLEQQFDVNTLPVQMELESKLPPQILEEVFEAKEGLGGEWNTDRLRTTLKLILKRKEGIKALNDQKKELHEQISPSYTPKPFRSNRPISPSNTPQTSLTFSISQPNNKPGTIKFPCIFCNQPDHVSHHCPNYNTIYTRKSRLYEKNLCLKCYRPDHIARFCQNPLICTHCHSPHPIALCPNLFCPQINQHHIDYSNEENNRSQQQEIPQQHISNFCSQMIPDPPTPTIPIPLSLLKFPEDFKIPTYHNNLPETKIELLPLNEVNSELKSLPIPDEPQSIPRLIRNCNQISQLPSPDPRTNSHELTIPLDRKLRNNNKINSRHTPSKAMKIIKINRSKPGISVPTDEVPSQTIQNESPGPPGDVPSVKACPSSLQQKLITLVQPPLLPTTNKSQKEPH